MSEFNEATWKAALIKVYERSLQDLDYRALCVSDPMAALAEVSDIELPPNTKIQFFAERADYIYTFLLPPLPDKQGDATTQAQLIQWATICTDMTTTATWPA